MGNADTAYVSVFVAAMCGVSVVVILVCDEDRMRRNCSNSLIQFANELNVVII